MGALALLLLALLNAQGNAQVGEYIGSSKAFAGLAITGNLYSTFVTAGTMGGTNCYGGVAASPDGGTLYIANTCTNRILAVTQTGSTVSTGAVEILAGDGYKNSAQLCLSVSGNLDIFCGRSVDHLVGVQASFYFPTSLFLSATGLYVLDGDTIRKVNLQTTGKPVTTIVSAAVLASLSYSFFPPVSSRTDLSFVVDALDTIYACVLYYNAVKKWVPGDTVFAPFAGSPSGGPPTGITDGTGTSAVFVGLTALSIAPDGNLIAYDYFSGSFRGILRMITPAAVVTTLAGKSGTGSTVSDGVGTAATFMGKTRSLAIVGGPSSWFIFLTSPYSSTIRRISSGGEVTTSTTSITPSNSDVISGQLGPLFYAPSFFDHNVYYPITYSAYGTCTPGSFCSGNLGITPCPGGTANPFSGSTSSASCVDCNAGTYSISGNTSCTTTPAGTYTLAQASAPVPCPGGTHVASTGASSLAMCIDCQAGEYSNAISGSTSCIDTLAGSYSLAKATASILCSPGTYSPTSRSSSCTYCPAGRYAANSGSTSCTDTPAGSFSLAQASATTLCSPGTYTSTSGSSFCASCPSGKYAASSGSTSCTDTPAGSFTLAQASATTLCSPGTYTSTSGSSSCTNCQAGRYSNRNYGSTLCLDTPAGTYTLAQASVPVPCPVGTALATSGASSVAQCTACPAGTINDAFSWGGPFAPGYLRRAQMFSIAFYGYGYDQLPTSLTGFALNSNYGGSTACSACVNGTFSTAGAAVCSMCADGLHNAGSASAGLCQQCPKGYFSNAIALVTATYTAYRTSNTMSTLPFNPGPWNAACTPCPSGTYSPAGPGAGSCTSPTLQCPQGSYCPPGSAAPTPCPQNTYSTVSSATSASVCEACPANFFTLSAGSTSCISSGSSFSCASGTQPRSPLPPTSAADCVPLTCPPHLALLGGTCVGCGGGSSGASGACTPCPAGLLCPGLTATPLLNFSTPATFGALANSAGTPAAPANCPLLTLPPSAAPSPPSSSAADPTSTAGYIGIGVTSLLLLFPLGIAGAACYSTNCIRKRIVRAAAASEAAVLQTAAAIKAWSLTSSYTTLLIKHLDIVSAGKPVYVVKVGGAQAATRLMGERQPSCLGFSTSLLGLGGLAVITAVLAVKRSTSNTLEQNSLVVLGSKLLADTAAWQWATAAAPGLPGPVPGVLLRVTASGGAPGECSTPLPGSLVASGLTYGAWTQLPATASPASAPYPASQLTFSCPTCLFSGTSALTFQLPFACQSLFLEAAAVGAGGAYATLSVPAASTAGQAGRLLASVLWDLTPLYDLHNDTVNRANNARGWQLMAKGSASTYSTPAAQAGGLLGVQPLAASVVVTFNLALQPFASAVTFTELQPILTFISSIVGFQGTVFGLVGLLFGLLASSTVEESPSKGAERGEGGREAGKETAAAEFQVAEGASASLPPPSERQAQPAHLVVLEVAQPAEGTAPTAVPQAAAEARQPAASAAPSHRFSVSLHAEEGGEDAAAEQPAEGPAATGAAAGTAQQGSKPSSVASPIYGEM